jgi:hypothetical protein
MIVDGIYRPLEGVTAVDDVMSQISEREGLPALDSYSRKGGNIIQESYRILLSDTELKIVQSFGSMGANTQFYIKDE